MEHRPYRTELTPVSFLRRSARTMPDQTAVVHEDRRYGYAELDQRVNRLASALRSTGLERHDRVAVLCPNTPALLEAHYGVPAAGGVLVAINTRLTSDEIGYILRDSGSKLLLVDHELERLLEPLELSGVDVVRVEDSGSSEDPYEELLAAGSPDPVESWLEDEDEPLSINYTSGTTGSPKGAVYNHRGAYLRALGLALETGLRYGSVHLWTLPMFHCNGWCYPWAVTAMAGRHVCLRKVDPARIWDLLESEGVTHFSGAPTVHISIVNHERAHPLEQSVIVPTGGAPPSPTLLAGMRELNLHPLHLYGLTESYGPHLACTPKPEWDDLPLEQQAALGARQGVAYNPADQLRVVDQQMQDVPADGETVGELVLRGNSIMSSYHDQPELTDEAFKGGWFHSGDLAVLHPDGYVELRDRMKDIIISGGENISTIEVEQAVVRHPAVSDAAVIAVPDEKWGERPKAFVELKPGEDATEDDIIAFSRQHLAGFKRPAYVEFGELPRTSTGKVQKHVLRERERERRDSAVS